MGAATISVDPVDESTVVIAVVGELDLSNVGELSRRVDRVRAEGRTGVVIDLDGLRHMDSSGLAQLLQAHLKLDEEGSRLAIVASSEQLRRTFEIRGVQELLTIAASRDEAIAAVGSDG